MLFFLTQSKSKLMLWSGVFALSLIVVSSHGQERADDQGASEGFIPPAEDQDGLDSTVKYPSEFFSQYEPISARDMLNRIPGIDSIIGGGGRNNNRRGLGAGENQILINGKRIAGKENDGRSVLGQIAASQVRHIEIIRGTSADLDIRSAGPIVNVVLRDNASKATITAELNADYYQQDGTFKPGAIISINGRGETLNYLATIESEPRYEQEERRETSVLGDGSPKDQTFESRERKQTNYKLNTTLGWQVTDSNLLQINALFEKNDPPRDIERSIMVLDPNDARLLVPGTPQLITQFDDGEAERHKWEFGTNFIHNFSNDAQYKLIVVVNEEIDNGSLIRTSDENGFVETILSLSDTRRARERIIRTSFNFPINEEQDLDFGIEGAQTTLDSLLVSSSKIEELRYEPFAVHNWTISSKMSLESALVAEISEITFDERGDLDSNGNPIAPQSRDFEFLKPKIDFRYDISPSLQFRATIEKDVSQLNFRDFTTRIDNDLDSDTDTGNASLVQQKAWKYDFHLEYRLPNDGGVLNAKVFYHDIEDHIDRVDSTSYFDTSVNPPVPIPYASLDPDSSPGNIGDAERYGLELDASIRLGFWSLPEALFTARLSVQDSSVTDPFLNEERRLAMGGRGGANIGFRHDVTKWNLNYGFNYNYGFNGGNRRVDIEDVRDFDRDPGSRVYIEKVAFNGIRFRFDVMNAFAGGRCLQRSRFNGFTVDNNIEEIEHSCVDTGRKMAIKIRTTF